MLCSTCTAWALRTDASSSAQGTGTMPPLVLAMTRVKPATRRRCTYGESRTLDGLRVERKCVIAWINHQFCEDICGLMQMMHSERMLARNCECLEEFIGVNIQQRYHTRILVVFCLTRVNQSSLFHNLKCYLLEQSQQTNTRRLCHSLV